MKPERYRNLKGDSGVTYYAIGPDFIAVQFQDPTVYIYDDSRPGHVHVEKMKALAVRGHGLGSYISQHVRKAFVRKQRSWGDCSAEA
jgi:hypothetical protein